MYRWAHIIPYNLVDTYFCQAFTILRAMTFVHLFRFFPLAVTDVLICLPVLSPQLDQFPPFADRVAAKEDKSRNCPTDASRYMMAIHLWLLPLASSRFYFAGLALVVRISYPRISSSYEISRSA